MLRDLLPDRMLAEHPELYFGDPDALPMPTAARALALGRSSRTSVARRSRARLEEANVE